MNKKRISALVTTLTLLASLTSCVSNKQYATLETEYKKAIDELVTVKNSLTKSLIEKEKYLSETVTLKNTIAELEAEKKKTLEYVDNLTVLTKGENDNIKETLSKLSKKVPEKIRAGIKKFNSDQHTYETGYTFLTKRSKEKNNYGLQSYLLFSQQPDENSEKRYRNIIKSFFRIIPLAGDLERHVKDTDINLTYIPLLKNPDYSYYKMSKEKKVDWIINNYDYARAKFFLSKLKGRGNLIKGPYIVSYKKPLSESDDIERGTYLFQNFSGVHHRIVSLWVEAFMVQSSKITYWDEKELRNYVNTLRNTIATGADAFKIVTISFSKLKERLKSLISID